MKQGTICIIYGFAVNPLDPGTICLFLDLCLLQYYGKTGECIFMHLSWYVRHETRNNLLGCFTPVFTVSHLGAVIIHKIINDSSLMILLITILSFISIMSHPRSTFDNMFALVRLGEEQPEWYSLQWCWPWSPTCGPQWFGIWITYPYVITRSQWTT